MLILVLTLCRTCTVQVFDELRRNAQQNGASSPAFKDRYANVPVTSTSTSRTVNVGAASATGNGAVYKSEASSHVISTGRKMSQDDRVPLAVNTASVTEKAIPNLVPAPPATPTAEL